MKQILCFLIFAFFTLPCLAGATTNTDYILRLLDSFEKKSKVQVPPRKKSKIGTYLKKKKQKVLLDQTDFKNQLAFNLLGEWFVKKLLLTKDGNLAVESICNLPGTVRTDLVSTILNVLQRMNGLHYISSSSRTIQE